MARKNLLAGVTGPKLTAVNSSDSPPSRPANALTGRGALGAVTRSIDEVAARARAAQELEAKLTAGQMVVELDTALVDPSFLPDRMGHDPAAHAVLRTAVAEQGQISPVLVRPHPVTQGRYQLAFGHRRLRVAQELGRPVRAVVRHLSDRELVLAQGQENSARTDLSFIERARFARRLEVDGYDRATIMAALAVDKTTASRMISVITRVPEDVIAAIGPAPTVGRDRWIELASLFEKQQSRPALQAEIEAAAFAQAASDDRFGRVFAVLAQSVVQTAGAARARPSTTPVFLAAPDGKRVIRVTRTDRATVLAINHASVPGFSEFLLGRIDSLLREHLGD